MAKSLHYTALHWNVYEVFSAGSLVPVIPPGPVPCCMSPMPELHLQFPQFFHSFGKGFLLGEEDDVRKVCGGSVQPQGMMSLLAYERNKPHASFVFYSCCSKIQMLSPELEIPQWVLDAILCVCTYLYILPYLYLTLEFKYVASKWTLRLHGVHIM